MSTPELVVALRLVEHWPRIFPGVETLARWTAQSVRCVRNALRSLEEAGFIRTTHNPGRASSYEFLDEHGHGIRVPSLGPVKGAPRHVVPDTPAPDAAPPARGAGPTPARGAAEADPDLKQESKNEMEAFGARPLPKYEFDKSWRPKKEHREFGLSQGLTDQDILDRAEHCRRKRYEKPIKTEDDQFHRELIWLRNDKQSETFKNQQRKATYANRPDENPGRDRRAGDRPPEPLFGRSRAG